MALPWLIGAAVVAVGAAVAKSISDDNEKEERERRERREREREIERENERKREEARRREKEEAERRRQAQIQAKQEYAKNEALSLFNQYNISEAEPEKMASLALKDSSHAEMYALIVWDWTYGEEQDKTLTELENRRKTLNQLQRQLQG